MENFQKLDAWQNGLQLLKEVYAISRNLPDEEKYGAISQIKRASTSILANIAEGSGRYTYADKANRFVIARGECLEVAAFLYMFVELEFVSEERVQKALELNKKQRMILSGLITSCRRQTIRK